VPDQPKDSIAQVSQSINWLVGLSGGAIGGALLKFDWLLKLRLSAKLVFLAASCCFLSSILFGVYYAFQMLAVGRYGDELNEAKAEWPPNEKRTNDAKDKVDKARDKARSYHLGTMFTFGLAGIATIVALCIALLAPVTVAKETKTPPNKYLINNSQVYVKGRLSHSHTFLVNQQTGEVWEMMCRKGNIVEFRRVMRTNYDGTEEQQNMGGGTHRGGTNEE
jgi:hypothetical protein